ncbi:MAG: SMC-Scp complex subunit ScpB [Acidobacteriota bacterium]
MDALREEKSDGTMTEEEVRPIVEALIYLAEEPVNEEQLCRILGKENRESIRNAIRRLMAEYQEPGRGLEIKEIADGYKMASKAEVHDWVRKYVKQQVPPIRLSLAALETLAVIAYKQPITVPEIQEIRGVNAAGVMKSLIDKKLITTAGRKNVLGRPILYKTSKEFLVHFGLKNLSELPSLEEFSELARSMMAEPADSAGTGTDGNMKQQELPLEGESQTGLPVDAAEEPVSEGESLPPQAQSDSQAEEPTPESALPASQSS